jgi:hypothetical protein
VTASSYNLFWELDEVLVGDNLSSSHLHCISKVILNIPSSPILAASRILRGLVCREVHIWFWTWTFFCLSLSLSLGVERWFVCCESYRPKFPLWVWVPSIYILQVPFFEAFLRFLSVVSVYLPLVELRSVCLLERQRRKSTGFLPWQCPVYGPLLTGGFCSTRTESFTAVFLGCKIGDELIH